MKSTPTLYLRFGLCILRLRENGKLTQDALAQRLRTSKGAVSLWERGLVRPSLHVLYAYSRVFEGEVTFHRLCDLAVEPHQAAWRDPGEEEATGTSVHPPTPKRGRHQHRRRQDGPRRTAAVARASQGGATPVLGGDDGQG